MQHFCITPFTPVPLFLIKEAFNFNTFGKADADTKFFNIVMSG